MARTEITYSDWVPNGELDDPAGIALNAGAGNGHFIDVAEPEKTVIRVVASAGGDITVVAGDYPPAIASGQGNFVHAVGIETVWLGPFESGRFLQGDGQLLIDVEAGATGTITAFKMPRNT